MWINIFTGNLRDTGEFNLITIKYLPWFWFYFHLNLQSVFVIIYILLYWRCNVRIIMYVHWYSHVGRCTIKPAGTSLNLCYWVRGFEIIKYLALIYTRFECSGYNYYFHLLEFIIRLFYEIFLLLKLYIIKISQHDIQINCF